MSDDRVYTAMIADDEAPMRDLLRARLQTVWPELRIVAEAANGTGEAKDALAQMGIALRDQSGNLRRSEDLLADVADAFARIEDPADATLADLSITFLGKRT